MSWVQRRLQLLVALPDPLLDALRSGQLSTWAASRILAPLARANTDHAQRLLAAVQAVPLSTRELKRWFAHYQCAQQAVRERLVSHPRLFLDTLAAGDQQRADAHLEAGPEGQALSDLRRLEGLLRQVRKRLGVLSAPVPKPLTLAGVRVGCAWRALHNELTRLIQDDCDRDPQQRAHAQGSGPQLARDQPPAQAVAQ